MIRILSWWPSGYTGKHRPQRRRPVHVALSVLLAAAGVAR